jgi:hypothetical protein
LDADDPDALLRAAGAAGAAVDGGDLVLPSEIFGPGVRLTPRHVTSFITPRTDTPA